MLAAVEFLETTTTPFPEKDDTSDERKGWLGLDWSDTGVMIGVSVGALLLVILVILIICMTVTLCTQSKKPRRAATTEEEAERKKMIQTSDAKKVSSISQNEKKA